MATVSIGGNDYEVYGDVAEADVYLAGQIAAVTWQTVATPDMKAVALVSATRLIDRQQWLGQKTDSYQPLDFPRTGLFFPNTEPPEEVPSNTVPTEVVDASFELASALLDGSTVQDVPLTDNLIQSLRAGSVAISYFRSLQGATSRFPLIIQELLGFWLAGSAVGPGIFSSGTHRRSHFEDQFDVNQGV